MALVMMLLLNVWLARSTSEIHELDLKERRDTMPTEIPALLAVEKVEQHRYRGQPEHDGDFRNVVFGGQILAQMIMAAHADRTDPETEQRGEKSVKSIHAIFARAGDYTQPIDYVVDRMHDGRTVGSDTVTFSQNDKIVSRGLILWSADEPDLISHTEWVSMPSVPGPEDPTNRTDTRVFPGSDCLIAGGVDTWKDDQPLHPPVQNVWCRTPGIDSEQPAHQATLAWGTDGFLIGTSMTPHEGYNEGQAHKTISTGVVSHTVNFHQPFDVSDWLLLSNESIWAGRGRVHGRANVWTADGQLVATYTQDALVRGWADGGDHTNAYQTIM